ncbi:hypothetical protein GEMRC1_007547 [Eukaryota sp. GEM-RC1]
MSYHLNLKDVVKCLYLSEPSFFVTPDSADDSSVSFSHTPVSTPPKFVTQTPLSTRKRRSSSRSLTTSLTMTDDVLVKLVGAFVRLLTHHTVDSSLSSFLDECFSSYVDHYLVPTVLPSVQHVFTHNPSQVRNEINGLVTCAVSEYVESIPSTAETLSKSLQIPVLEPRKAQSGESISQLEANVTRTLDSNDDSLDSLEESIDCLIVKKQKLQMFIGELRTLQTKLATIATSKRQAGLPREVNDSKQLMRRFLKF